MNCCYQCENRHMHCHVTCTDYKKFSAQNAVERDKRARESRIRQMLMTICVKPSMQRVSAGKQGVNFMGVEENE